MPKVFRSSGPRSISGCIGAQASGRRGALPSDRVRGACGTILCAAALLSRALGSHASSAFWIARPCARSSLRRRPQCRATALACAPRADSRAILPRRARHRALRRRRRGARRGGRACLARTGGPTSSSAPARTPPSPRCARRCARSGRRVKTSTRSASSPPRAPPAPRCPPARARPAVAYVERDRRLHATADAFDVPDPAHANIPLHLGLRRGARRRGARGRRRRVAAQRRRHRHAASTSAIPTSRPTWAPPSTPSAAAAT